MATLPNMTDIDFSSGKLTGNTIASKRMWSILIRTAIGDGLDGIAAIYFNLITFRKYQEKKINLEISRK